MAGVLGLTALSGHAASVCPIPWGHECSWGSPFPPHLIYEMGIYGFSTSDVPCQQALSAGHRVFISSSAIDPNEHTGPVTGDSLYLWMYSGADGYGYGWASAQTTFTGDIHVTGFEPIPPGGGSFDGDWLTFGYDPGGDWDCPRFGWGLAGRLLVQLPVAVEPQTWGRMKALYR
jgi:hypothetical protein